MSVYISGPISLDPEYKQKFEKADRDLQSLGYSTVNPVDIAKQLETSLYPAKPSYEEYMKACIRELLNCDKIFMLKNWEKSKGAKLEYDIARVLKIPEVKVSMIRSPKWPA